MAYQTPYGMHDILPREQPSWRHMERCFEDLCRRYGFQRIDTPIVEYTAVFLKGVGEGTDIVEKEMYYFTDKGGDNLALRPEFTAAIIRSFIQQGMRSWPQPVKLWSIGPLFRRDRPGAGRYRQFHQVNAEIIGTDDPAADAELIDMASTYARRVGLTQCTLELNSTGCPECKPRYIEKLVVFLREKRTQLGELDRERIERNPLRVLDSKDEATQQALSEGVPLLRDYLCDRCRSHYREVCSLITTLGLSVRQEPKLVRGLDYYTRTVFELFSTKAPQVGAVLGGGRYDGLAEILGGPPTAAVGFAGGIERMILALKAERRTEPPQSEAEVFVAYVGEKTKEAAFGLARELREAGAATALSLGRTGLKSQLKRADRTGATFVIIVGEAELAQGKVQLRNMRESSQKLISLSEATQVITRLMDQKPS